MNQTATLTLVDRLSLTLDGLCRAVAARIAPGRAGWPMQAAMIMLVWTRVRRAEQRIKVLLARFRAGTLRVMPAAMRPPRDQTAKLPRDSTAKLPRDPTAKLPRDPTAKLPRDPTAKLPRGFAWLLPMVPCDAANLASQLRAMLAEPEMQGLLEASAQARRVLAPVCRMLGIEAELLRPSAPQARVPESRAGGVRPEGDGEFTTPPLTDAHAELYRIRWDGD